MFVELQSCAVLREVQPAYKIYSLIKKNKKIKPNKTRQEMAGKNFDAATDTIKITEMTLVIGNVVLPCACCAQTGRANCTLGFK